MVLRELRFYRRAAAKHNSPTQGTLPFSPPRGTKFRKRDMESLFCRRLTKSYCFPAIYLAKKTSRHTLAGNHITPAEYRMAALIF